MIDKQPRRETDRWVELYQLAVSARNAEAGMWTVDYEGKTYKVEDILGYNAEVKQLIKDRLYQNVDLKPAVGQHPESTTVDSRREKSRTFEVNKGKPAKEIEDQNVSGKTSTWEK
jgi:hypothetical protein